MILYALHFISIYWCSLCVSVCINVFLLWLLLAVWRWVFVSQFEHLLWFFVAALCGWHKLNLTVNIIFLIIIFINSFIRWSKMNLIPHATNVALPYQTNYLVYHIFFSVCISFRRSVFRLSTCFRINVLNEMKTKSRKNPQIKTFKTPYSFNMKWQCFEINA